MAITPGSSSSMKRMSVSVLQHAQQVLTVGTRGQTCRQPPQLVGVDVAHVIRDFLYRGDEQTLPLFHRLHEIRGVDERVVRAGVEPGDAARQGLHVQLSPIEVLAVDIGDLELASSRWLESGGDVE